MIKVDTQTVNEVSQANTVLVSSATACAPLSLKCTELSKFQISVQQRFLTIKLSVILITVLSHHLVPLINEYFYNSLNFHVITFNSVSVLMTSAN